jgi:hypothetical protein
MAVPTSSEKFFTTASSSTIVPTHVQPEPGGASATGTEEGVDTVVPGNAASSESFNGSMILYELVFSFAWETVFYSGAMKILID